MIKKEIAKDLALAYKEQHGKFPTVELISILSQDVVSESTARTAMRELKRENNPLKIKYTKAQENQIQAKIVILENSFEDRVKKEIQLKIEEVISWRDTKDAEIIEQANILIKNQRNKPFTSAEYVGIMRALHPDTTTPENRMEAFKLINNKKLLLREEGRITTLSSLAPTLPRTPEEWAARRKAVAEERKSNKIS
jgi:hypothetical protein